MGNGTPGWSNPLVYLGFGPVGLKPFRTWHAALDLEGIREASGGQGQDGDGRVRPGLYARRPAVSQTRRRGRPRLLPFWALGRRPPGHGWHLSPRFIPKPPAANLPASVGRYNDDGLGTSNGRHNSPCPDGVALGGSSNGGPPPGTLCSTEVAATCTSRVPRRAHRHATAQSTSKIGLGGSPRGENWLPLFTAVVPKPDWDSTSVAGA